MTLSGNNNHLRFNNQHKLKQREKSEFAILGFATARDRYKIAARCKPF